MATKAPKDAVEPTDAIEPTEAQPDETVAEAEAAPTPPIAPGTEEAQAQMDAEQAAGVRRFDVE